MKLGEKENFRNTRFVGGLRALAVELSWVSRASLKLYFRYPAWILSDIITTPAWLILFLFPVLMFLPRSQWNNTFLLNSFFWAMILWDVVSSGLWSFGMAIRREQQTGTLEFLLLTNANRAVIFSRNIIPRIVSLSLTLIYTYLFFTLMFNTEIILYDPLHVILVLLTGLFTSMGFGLIYGALVLRFKNVGPLNNILQFIILGLGGIFYPVTSLPRDIQLVSLLIPFTYIAELLRFHALRAQTIIPVEAEWAILIASTLLLDFIGIVLLYAIERRLKKTGRLAGY
ncbi:MAG: ABC transporter permease [Infirmifilum sp.]